MHVSHDLGGSSKFWTFYTLWGVVEWKQHGNDPVSAEIWPFWGLGGFRFFDESGKLDKKLKRLMATD